MSDGWSETKQLRLVVVGSGRVGKTSLVWQFMHGRLYSGRYQPTIEDSYRKLIQLPDGRYKSIEILDTAGMHQFPAMRDLSIRSSQCFIVVFAINSRPSFNEAEQLINHIFHAKGSRDVPLVLVGNKRDLVEWREVSTADGVHLATKCGCSFVETSAKCDVSGSVSDVFSHLVTRGFQQVSTSRSSPATTDPTHPLPGATAAAGAAASLGRGRPPLGRSRSAGGGIVRPASSSSGVSNGNGISSFFAAMATTGGERSSSKKKRLEGEESEEEEVDGRRGSWKRRGKKDARRKKDGRCTLL